MSIKITLTDGTVIEPAGAELIKKFAAAGVLASVEGEEDTLESDIATSAANMRVPDQPWNMPEPIEIDQNAEDQRVAIENARREAISADPSLAEFPYLREAYATDGNKYLALARDLAAAIPQGLTKLYDAMREDGDAYAPYETSEEYAKQGRTGRAILASPSLVPSTLAALYTGGMSIPIQIGSQVGVNSLFLPGYGAEGVALDALLTALPAGAGLVAGKAKGAGMTAIRKALEAKGIKNVADDVVEQAYSMWSGKTAGEAISKKGADKLAPMLPGPPTIHKGGILKGLYEGHPEVDFRAAKDMVAASTSRTNIPGAPALRRTEDQAADAIRRLDAAQARLEMIRQKAISGGYDPEFYRQEMAEALGSVADIPEAMRAIEKSATPVAQVANWANTAKSMHDASFMPSKEADFLADALAVKVAEQDLAKPLNAMAAGKALQSTGPEFSMLRPLESLAAKASVNKPANLRLAELALRGAAPVSPAALLPYRSRLKDYYNQGGSQ